MRKRELAVTAALALTLFAWGMSYVWTKIALAEMGPFTLVCFRFVLATGLFVLAYAVTGRRPQRLSRADHGRLFLLALMQPVGHFAFETCGLVLTTATAAALIVATIPLTVAGLDAALGRSRPGLGELARILASIVGVGCVIAGGTGLRLGGQLAGDLLMVGAVVSTAGYVVLGGALTRRLDAWTVTFAQLAWGAALFAPGCAFELARRGWPPLSGRGAAALAALTVLASFAAFLCYNFALARLSATRAALWLNAVPVVTALAAWAFLGERLTLLEAVGGAVVCAAVAAPGWRRGAAAREQREA
ncbi:DMT family transporter [Solidesulfovibrio alcoholivorans]|uniref:DMT family transporter n=1 Tax=Solidesulfovibrio alcoholivorans TaxID=81406 RepID=UPI0004965466|nr:DMT family transporter [Solidesulfovibrio alcoholivorans]